MDEPPWDSDEDWQSHPEVEGLAVNFGAKDVVGEGNTAVSAGGCGATLTL